MMQLEPTPDLGAMYAAMDQFDLDSARCLCDWDGSPDAKRSRIPNCECPVHVAMDAEDDYERGRR